MHIRHRIFKKGIMRSRSYSDGYGKAAHARKSTSLHCYTSPAPHFWYGWQHRRSFPRRPRPAERARQAHGVATAFSVSRNSFVRFSSIPINSDSFVLIRANTTNRGGFLDCYFLLESGIIITVSNELQPKLSL